MAFMPPKVQGNPVASLIIKSGPTGQPKALMH
jgi:hypothetical protein